MLVCVHCRMEMKCAKTGLGVRFYKDHVYAGDMFRCVGCGAEVIRTNDQPTYDPKGIINTIMMPSRDVDENKN